MNQQDIDFWWDFGTGYVTGALCMTILAACVISGCSKDPGVPVECHCAKCEAGK